MCSECQELLCAKWITVSRRPGEAGELGCSLEPLQCVSAAAGSITSTSVLLEGRLHVAASLVHKHTATNALNV